MSSPRSFASVRVVRRTLAVLVALVSAGCADLGAGLVTSSAPESCEDTDAGPSGDVDAGEDASADAGLDAALDAGVDAGTSEPDAGQPTCACATRDLGALPTELATLAWPALPITTTVIDVDTDSELRAALDGFSNVTVRVHGDHAGFYTVRGSDVEVLLDADASIEALTIAWSQQRIRIAGGTFDTIQIALPIDFNAPSRAPQEHLMVSDVTIECVDVRSSDTAFFLHGRRIAIVGADVIAARYALFTGLIAPLHSEDVIVAHSVLRSAGPEATVRFHEVERAVVARSTLTNPGKHNWRVHGVSSLAYLGDSTLVGTGFMLGNEPGDAIDHAWIVRSTLHYTGTNGIAIVSPTTTRSLTIADDVFYSDTPFGLPPAPSDWIITANVTLPYAPPPPDDGACP
ncbi:hypothetical protein [Sandaracinus amylolyticus]|uniref:Right handed beta helix domain-containing protein n=1 Tax=Sandaracinus amylolyticus TaxID=927083 RepID=A0A0F6W2M9_9BACT|nr:hypothetical protein [Sandaracinus amylolyticus]AKF05702.1 hypothetical protein DB32_002851 [Sandaracinus amylolyticus]